MNNPELCSQDPMTTDIVESGVVSWEDLLRSVRRFHYGRNANRHDLSLVWSERKGSCSSKHAFLKWIADLNDIEGVKLCLCIYKMTEANTPGIAPILSGNGLTYIPEAHCFIRVNNEPLDVTSPHSSLDPIAHAILHEEHITPEQVVHYKVEQHQAFLRAWIEKEQLDYTFEEIWSIREECIIALSK